MSTVESAAKAKTAFEYVYPFGKNLPLPPLSRELLGGKGKNLAEMTSIGVPVPPGFIITTEACNAYRSRQRSFPDGLESGIEAAMKILEATMGRKFGDENNPLLVSVRSGARVSMPGMMDTVLNLGLNDSVVKGFAKAIGDEAVAYNCYLRLISMYADVVVCIPRKHFSKAFQSIKMEEGVEDDRDVSVEGLKKAVDSYLKIFEQHAGKPFPQNPKDQLVAAVAAVFDSWDSERATLYRQVHHYPDEWGTGVIVQTMVFGNRGNSSATGVGFTRNPATGENAFYGEFLTNAQGEDVVAGIRTPHPLNTHQKKTTGSTLKSLEEQMPEIYKELSDIVDKLEHHYGDMQDIEFTVEEGTLYMLQTRTGKRTGFAAIRMAVEMSEEGIIDEKMAMMRVEPAQLIQLLAPIFKQEDKEKVTDKMVDKGINAGPGAASGLLALSSERAVALAEEGHHCILAREEASPDDFPGMVASEGILTTRGGATSHAAVVARGLGKPCVVGCDGLHIDEDARTVSCNGSTIKEGDPISIDGTTGEVFFCSLQTSPSEVVQVLVDGTKKVEDSLICQQYLKIMELADKYRILRVRTNADNAHDAGVARAFGAEGIGLCRTEHMFLDQERLLDVRRMFFSANDSDRHAAIQRLLRYQKSDFVALFREMEGLPVTVRLLDPPLHEFMPHSEEEIETLAGAMKMSVDKLLDIRSQLQERNPMLGHRGCRLGIIYPEITRMQTRAILEAAIEVSQEGKEVIPEIMVPLVGMEKELEHQKLIIDDTAEKVFKEKGTKVEYSVGTMIELPRAALMAGSIAQHAEFFSFGTNDLTQTTFGISRDDSAKFVPSYVEGVPHPQSSEELMRIMEYDPFQVLDREGVGKLMEIAVTEGKKVLPNLKCGICGEHGGDSKSIMFCHSLGLNYASCSPYRVPVARLAAAQATVMEESE